jgi:spermidine/putrescine transport system substrate-binding protein
MTQNRQVSSTLSTLLAAHALTRRMLIRRATAAAAVTTSGPWYVKSALSSSGELSILNWDDELPNPLIPDFEKKTGIKVKTTPFSQNEEQINKLQAAGGEGFDLCQPTCDRAPQFKDIGVLAPFDPNRLHLDNLLPALLEGSTSGWTWDKKLYYLPHCWGSEAISWRTDVTSLEYKTLSYSTMWNDEYKGKVQGRPHSLLLGIGLWMDATGKLKSNRMRDTFDDADKLKKVYDVILKFAIDHKPWIKQFWNSANSTKSGLLENGVVIGQTWDGPVLSLKKAGKPVSYMAPQEGAIVWIDGWAITKAAKNQDQAYAWLNYLQTSETAAKLAESSGYNPVVKGADKLLSAAAGKNFAEAYPEDALSRLWNRPPEPPWLADMRAQYAETFKAA